MANKLNVLITDTTKLVFIMYLLNFFLLVCIIGYFLLNNLITF